VAKSATDKKIENIEADLEGLAQLVTSYSERIAELEALMKRVRAAVHSQGLET
jgi:peptidoglycan hydrolase CwlO-like protein